MESQHQEAVFASKMNKDPRLEQVASLQICLKESEADFTIVGYASNPRQAYPSWIIHVLFEGKLIHEKIVSRLDQGHDFSHNDLTLLGKAVDELKQLLNPRIDVHSNTVDR